jgi:hypothetical protein
MLVFVLQIHEDFIGNISQFHHTISPKMSKVPHVSDFRMHVNMDGIDDVKSYYVHMANRKDALPGFDNPTTYI